MQPIHLEIAVICLGLLLLLLESFSNGGDRRWIGLLGIGGLLVVGIASIWVQPGSLPANSPLAPFYAVDSVAIFFKQFSLLATLLVLVLALDFAPVVERFVPGANKGAGLGEFYALPVLTCAGLMFLVSAQDFIFLFVSLELVTIGFYVLVAYLRRNSASLEAGVKYLILGALSTGIIVYGITWIYGMTGQTNFALIHAVLPKMIPVSYPAVLFGLALVIVALGFKIGAFPFQFWIPDVYQGAPTPVTAFLSVASKAAGFVVLYRVVQTFLVPGIADKLLLVLAVLSGATLLFGNLAALVQKNFKRLMAYSSVAHAGYLLMGFASIGVATAEPAIFFYLVGYLIMTFLAFGVMTVVSVSIGSDEISSFNGLGRRSPLLALAMLVSMLSLAGIPFTVGFFAKFFIFETAIRAGLYWLVAIGLLSVACGFYYYLKIARAMYWLPSSEATGDAAPAVSPLTCWMLIGLMAATCVLGVYPNLILRIFAGS